jgi:CHASE3 domain sensor protein
MLATSKQTHGSDHDITKKIRAKMDEFVSSSLLLSGLNIPDNISDLLNNRSPTGPEQIQQTFEQLASLCTSPQVQDIIANPAKMDEILDTMRPSIMTALNEMENSNNVMIKMFLNQMKEQESLELEGGWEALKQSIEDPEQWREMTSEFVAQMSAMRGAGGGMMG